MHSYLSMAFSPVLHIYCQVILPCLQPSTIANSEKMDTNAQWFHSSWSILLKRVNIRVRGFHLVFFKNGMVLKPCKSWDISPYQLVRTNRISELVFSRMRSEGFPFIVGVWGWTCVRVAFLVSSSCRRRVVVVSSSCRRRVVVASSSPTR